MRRGSSSRPRRRPCLLPVFSPTSANLKPRAKNARSAQQTAATALKILFTDASLPVMSSTTHIIPPMVGNPAKAKRVSDILLAEWQPKPSMHALANSTLFLSSTTAKCFLDL